MSKYTKEVWVFWGWKLYFLPKKKKGLYNIASFKIRIATKRLISSEREGFRGSNFVRFILGI